MSADEPRQRDERPLEELQRDLDAIVARLEQGEVGVDEAIELWQRGEALFRECALRLDAAELRIEELARAAQPDETDDSTPGVL